MTRRYRRRSRYRSREEVGREYARAHIEAARRLTTQLGGVDQDVKQYFFNLPPNELRLVLDAYEQEYGANKRAYATQTMEAWRTGRRQMGGEVAERLFKLLPPRMPLATKYSLIENLWKHVGPRSKKTLRIGVDVSVEQIVDAVRMHIDESVVRYRIPDSLERRFEWLASGDSHVKQDLLNHLRRYEKALVVEGARLQLPVMLAHMRSVAGSQTHRLAQVLKIGNHELELQIDKGASGVAIIEPQSVQRSTGAAKDYEWILWIIAAAVILYFVFRR
jgi:hypothetical protein